MKWIAKYVGLKPQEVDCVAGTNLVWVGLHSEHEVPASAVPIMSKHPDVWELREEVESEVTGSLSDADIPKNRGGRPPGSKNKPKAEAEA